MEQSINSGNEELLNDLEQRKRLAENLGGEDKIRRQHEAGSYTARERIELLVDSGSFLEFGKLNGAAGNGDGLIGGIAEIDGRPVVVQAGDKTVAAGTEGAVHLRKSKALHGYAQKRGLPMINLNEGGGLRMPDGMGSNGISDKLFPQEMLLNNREIPVLTAVLGDSYGGPTWTAVSSDVVIQRKGASMAVAGPRMLEIATGQKLEPEELGGWAIHAKNTGQADAFGDSEESCIEQLKMFFRLLPQNAGELPPTRKTADSPDRSTDGALGILPERRNQVYDMRELVKELVDDGVFVEYKGTYGEALLTGFAHLDGRTVGIVANQPKKYAGAAGPKECEKATDFICLCDSFHIPLIFLHDTPGFRVSAEAEKEKMPTKIMVWNQALAQSTVPKISVVIRKSIGAAYGNMCGPGMGGDFVVAWPTAEINFTGPEVGINVVYGRQLQQSDNPAEDRKKLLDGWAFDSSPYKAAAEHLIDDVIDPRDTRKFLCRTLKAACSSSGGRSGRRLAGWPTGF